MDRKRIVLIFGAAWVSAALLTWFLYAATKAPHVEKMTSIVASKAQPWRRSPTIAPNV